VPRIVVSAHPQLGTRVTGDGAGRGSAELPHVALRDLCTLYPIT
jgi:hypothetical protein